MEIQKYNVIVYIMLVLKKKHMRVTSVKEMATVFHSKVHPVKPCQERTKVRVKIVLSGDFHCNIRWPAQRIGVGVFFLFFSSCNMEVLIICI